MKNTFEEGTYDLSKYVDYRSDNTTILNVEQTKREASFFRLYTKRTRRLSKNYGTMFQ